MLSIGVFQMKEKGIKPVRPWQERPVYVSSTTATLEAFVPPEGDGKVSALSTAVSVSAVGRMKLPGFCVFVHQNAAQSLPVHFKYTFKKKYMIMIVHRLSLIMIMC